VHGPIFDWFGHRRPFSVQGSCALTAASLTIGSTPSAMISRPWGNGPANVVATAEAVVTDETDASMDVEEGGNGWVCHRWTGAGLERSTARGATNATRTWLLPPRRKAWSWYGSLFRGVSYSILGRGSGNSGLGWVVSSDHHVTRLTASSSSQQGRFLRSYVAEFGESRLRRCKYIYPLSFRRCYNHQSFIEYRTCLYRATLREFYLAHCCGL